jgi:hypothetical protein
MKTITLTLQSIEGSPYSQSRRHDTPKIDDRESPDDYDKRTWREHLHADAKGEVYIPGTAIKQCLDNSAAYLKIKIPGQRNATYTKKFISGIMVVGNLPLGIAKDTVPSETLYLNADGKKGGGVRVQRMFPKIEQWEGKLEVLVLDDVITETIFIRVLEEAGKFIGLGRFRPEKSGFYGRFMVKPKSISVVEQR